MTGERSQPPSERAGPMPLISVVVPTYNRPGPLARCLEALNQQTYPHGRMEVLVVDDGGTADLRAAVAQLNDFGQVAILEQENRGPGVARNSGAARGMGEFVAFTDDDCRPRPDWIVHLVEALEGNRNAMIGGRVVNGLTDNDYAQASQDLVSFLYEHFGQARALRPFFTTNNVAVHRETFLQVGGFDQSFRFSAGEDRDLSERWETGVGPLKFVADAVVDHFHELNFRRFLLQHHYYGRGAANLARCRRARGEATPFPEPMSFYARMVGYPLRGRPLPRGVWLGFLIALSQLVSLTGMLVETLIPAGQRAPRRARCDAGSGGAG